MEINYWWIGLFLVLIAALVIWLVKKNRKDEKAYENEIIQSEMKHKDHDNDHADTEA